MGKTKKILKGMKKFGKSETGKLLRQTINTGIQAALVGSGPYRIKGESKQSEVTYKKYQKRGNTVLRDIKFNGPEKIIFSHREYIGDVITSSVVGQFNLNAYSIQPGDYVTFPWLSNIAHSFNKYKFKQLVFEYISTSGMSVNATNTSLGKMAVAVNYDCNDTNPADLKSIIQYDSSSMRSPAQTFAVPVECGKENSPYNQQYVRSLLQDSKDLLYDLGTLYVGTDGFQGTSVNIGSIFVKYTIELSGAAPVPAPSDIYYGSSTTVSASNYFNGIKTDKTKSTFEMTNPANNRIAFPSLISSGQYLLYLTYTSSSVTVDTPTWAGTNCTINSNITTPNNGVITTSLTSSLDITVTDEGAYIDVSSFTAPLATLSVVCVLVSV